MASMQSMAYMPIRESAAEDEQFDSFGYRAAYLVIQRSTTIAPARDAHTGDLADQKAQPLSVKLHSCKDLTLRREWRSFSLAEKHDYTRAVKCLSTSPSPRYDKNTVYDDFPLVHSTFSNITHDAAPFLSWHRYFIHVYETALRSQCDYGGSLAYWDWTLDWEDLARSPIWDMDVGFGGNGNPDQRSTTDNGYCMEAGPYASLRPQYYASHACPHCLSRNFTKTDTQRLRPDMVDKVMESSDYETLFIALEKGPHNVIPNMIGGDFLTFTAPNDPVFYLHHAQIDRLWWLWQQRDRPARFHEYGGKATAYGTEQASLGDTIPMGGLAKDVLVSEVMNTEDGILCYRY